jgi:hypothetical protein
MIDTYTPLLRSTQEVAQIKEYRQVALRNITSHLSWMAQAYSGNGIPGLESAVVSAFVSWNHSSDIVFSLLEADMTTDPVDSLMAVGGNAPTDKLGLGGTKIGATKEGGGFGIVAHPNFKAIELFIGMEDIWKKPECKEDFGTVSMKASGKHWPLPVTWSLNS